MNSPSPRRGGPPIKVGVIADQTGPLGPAGIANANVARMVVGDINAKGGLLGRPLELHLEDGATDDAVAAAKAAKLVQQDQVDVLLGGIFSSTRQAIKGPAVVEGKTLYIYPEQYEGQESDPLIFCTGPVPAQQVDPLIHWLMESGARVVLPALGRLHLAARHERARARDRHLQRRHDHRRGVLPDGSRGLPRDRRAIVASGTEVVFNTIVPPGVTPFFAQLHEAGFMRRGGKLICTYFDENFLPFVPAEHVEGLYSCLDYYQAVSDPFSQRLLAQYKALYPGDAQFTGGSGCSGLYRGLRFWAEAVEEAGSLDRRT